MTARAARVGIALLLEAAAVTLLGLVLLGRPWPAERGTAAVYVLADRSASVPAAGLRRALEELAAAAQRTSPPAELYVCDFAGRPGTPRRLESRAETALAPAIEGLMPDATNLAEALRATMITTAPRPVALVVLSDGNATEGDTKQALQGAANAGIPVLWRTVAATTSLPRIAEVLAPAVARPTQRIPVTVRMTGIAERPLRLTITAHDGSAEPVTTAINAGPLVTATLRLISRSPGPLLLDVELADAATSRRLDSKRLAAAIDVQAPADVLYVVDGPSALAHSLRTGGWTLASVASRGLDPHAADFGRYAAVVLDDVPASAALPATWDALATAVRDRGVGLLVLGGGRSFAAGSYRGSRLEEILPVVSRPSALGDAAALAFVVDKSGSMGASAAGVDRFRLAQRAVVETAATLTGRDSATLIVFDVNARNLVPMQAAAQFRQAVAAPWAAQPRGGTRVAPAVEMAVGQLEAAPESRRILVLVTDGFIDTAPVDALRARLSRARIELIALAVGPDADASALSRLVDPGHGTILRVDEAAQLPALMRGSVESRRAPIERGRIDVRTSRPLPFRSPQASAWPPVSAYAVTSPRPDAIVHLESARGDPLVAYRQAGLGRVVVVTSGLGSWTPEWLRWQGWPALAGGLVEWVASSGVAPDLALSAIELPAGLRVDVDAATHGLWAKHAPELLHLQLPSGLSGTVRLEASAPGRTSALLPDPEPGLYTFTVTTPEGTQRLTHLHQPARELGRIGPSPHIAEWRRAGLVRDASAAELARTMRAIPASSTRLDRPVLLALVLFLAGVVLDRWPVTRSRPAIARSWRRPGGHSRRRTGSSD